MDLSKLPRMSQTPAPPPAATVNAPESANSAPTPVSTGNPPIAAEVWISVVMGIVLLLIWPNTLLYTSHQLLHTRFAPYPTLDAEHNQVFDVNKRPIMSESVTLTDGSTIPYRQTTPAFDPNYWSDLAVTLFAAALIVEGFALVLSRRPIVVLFALVVTLSATIFNLGYFFATFREYGMPMVSLVAIILGGYMTIYQIGLFSAARRFPAK